VLTKRQKGIVIRFLLQVTGYSRQQLTRLIQQYLNTGVVQLRDINKPAGFKQTYTTTDIALLAPYVTWLSGCVRFAPVTNSNLFGFGFFKVSSLVLIPR
jgi:hypothetical protein